MKSNTDSAPTMPMTTNVSRSACNTMTIREPLEVPCDCVKILRDPKLLGTVHIAF